MVSFVADPQACGEEEDVRIRRSGTRASSHASSQGEGRQEVEWPSRPRAHRHHLSLYLSLPSPPFRNPSSRLLDVARSAVHLPLPLRHLSLSTSTPSFAGRATTTSRARRAVDEADAGMSGRPRSSSFPPRLWSPSLATYTSVFHSVPSTIHTPTRVAPPTSPASPRRPHTDRKPVMPSCPCHSSVSHCALRPPFVLVTSLSFALQKSHLSPPSPPSRCLCCTATSSFHLPLHFFDRPTAERARDKLASCGTQGQRFATRCDYNNTEWRERTRCV